MNRLGRAAIAVAIGVAAGLAALALTRAPLTRALFEPLELLTLDWRVRSRPAQPPDSSAVRLVLFDSATVAAWPYLVPFPRAALADLVDAAASAGASAIGLDVFLERRYPELDAIDDGDARLREAIRRAGNVVLVAPTVGSSTERRLLRPDPFFADVAAAVGTADLPTPYETIRNGVLTVRTDTGLVAGFPLALYAIDRGLRLDSLLAATARQRELRLPGLPRQYAALPALSATQEKPILFVGPPSRPDYAEADLPAFHVVSGSVAPALAQFAPDFFRGRIVLLGSGFHAEERFRSPYYLEARQDGEQYGWTYGVEVHANTLDNLLRGRHPVPLEGAQVVALLVLLGVLVSGGVFRHGLTLGASAALTLTAATIGGAWVLFGRTLLHVPVIAPTLAVGLAFLGATAYVSVLEGRRAREIRGMFSKYVSPAVVDQLIADPSRLKLGGEKREISILFSDLAGFTSLSESMPPERLITLLNRYLDEMVRIVKEEGGLKDKFIGDAVMALYGTPAELPDHALRACRTALRMQEKLQELNRSWRADGWPELTMRIGVNTGSPVVGNIGGEEQFDYTALGDAVNLAARLEPACKSYGVSIMIAEATRRMAGDAVRVRLLDQLAVYGKAESIQVWELVGLTDASLAREREELLSLYDRGLDAFFRRDWELALGCFRSALEIDPGDGPSALYAHRCEEYRLSPPPEEWDFVERRQVK
jgi:class 3 adenylate cyclase/CHASE2 domain-containing sensor protein